MQTTLSRCRRGRSFLATLRAITEDPILFDDGPIAARGDEPADRR